MLQSHKYKKEYTRDYSYIMEEGWHDVMLNAFKRFGRPANAARPPVIYHMNEGAIEVWEHEGAAEWIIQNLQSMMEEDGALASEILDQHEKELSEIKKIWDRKCIASKEELKAYIKVAYEYMYNFALMYYMAVNENSPDGIRQRALKIRDADTYFGSNDDMIRLSLRTLYPELAGFETAILFREIDNPPTKEVLAARKKNSTLDGKNITIGTFSEFRSGHPEYEYAIEALPADNTAVKGQIANKGYAKGRVRILKLKEQMFSIIPGDIIVSPMTTPEFVPAMKIASAIVTDEGGITCHAAIVARELKMPCVIGTKVATQVFRDGDMVEVDADAGTVRLIER